MFFLTWIAFLALIALSVAFNDTEAKACTDAAHKILVTDNYVVEDIQVSAPTESGKIANIVVIPKTKTREDVRAAGWAGIAAFDVLQAKNPEVSGAIISVRYHGEEYKMLIFADDLTKAHEDGVVHDQEIEDIMDILINRNG